MRIVEDQIRRKHIDLLILLYILSSATSFYVLQGIICPYNRADNCTKGILCRSWHPALLHPEYERFVKDCGFSLRLEAWLVEY